MNGKMGASVFCGCGRDVYGDYDCIPAVNHEKIEIKEKKKKNC